MIQQISLEQYNLLLNNKVLFQNIKKVNDKLYVSFIGDTSGDRKIILCKDEYFLNFISLNIRKRNPFPV